jgi:deoxyribonuclease V
VRPVVSHRWDLREEEASALQTELASLVVTRDRLPERITVVAGVDVAYEDHGARAFAAIAVVDVASGAVEHLVSAEAVSPFP